ncbi:MAG: acetyl-CoA C-acyltransferase, partial [Parvularcula sp.]|nr:acetyl-CoA C-acyltransferase [Parvularcula sp.]
MKPVFICGYRRTPFGRYGGILATKRPDDLAAACIAAVRDEAGIDGNSADEVVLGCANQAGEDNRNIARMAALLSGLPETVPALTVNRLCGSGLDAVAVAARRIALGEIGLAVAGGVESMTRAPLVMAKAERAFDRQTEIFDTTIGWRFVNPQLAKEYGKESMPVTAENLAAAFSISREDQDAYAARSQERFEKARANGFFTAEILPVAVRTKKEELIVDKDEHPRPGTCEADLAKLPAPFRENGTVTAGNASGVNDGAAALLLASEEAVALHNLIPLARIEGFATAGVAPSRMGIGPVPATRKLIARFGLEITDFDLIELNEAFAAQVLAVSRSWALADDDPRINPRGGAIAVGHPLGASGA